MSQLPTENRALVVAEPPPVPHVTTNIISLSSILRKFSEFSFTELSYVLSTQPNDELKKKKLLELIVHLRKEFVRLYVLLKWSKSSSVEFTKLIDLLCYLKEQTQHFTNLLWATQSLNQSLLSAKLPNPDIVTSLEVLNNGEPILPTHNLIKRKELSNAKVLKVLKDLNVLLSIKFAMVDNIPQVFLEDYEIKDGRIYIRTKDYQFQLSILDEKSSFILIDFQFTTNGEENAQAIPSCTKLRKVANEILKRGNFMELEKIFKNYDNTIKFYLIHLKLNKIKHIKHQYHPEKFLIILNYWIPSFVFKNSYIEIGLNKSDVLIYRWFKSGKFIKTFKDIQDIEIFLHNIQFKHTQQILSQINELYVNNSLLQLNPSTGLFYFKNSTPFLNNSLKKLNIDDFRNINENLKQLKLSHRFMEIILILTVTNWQLNDSQKFAHSDLKKILSSGNSSSLITSASPNPTTVPSAVQSSATPTSMNTPTGVSNAATTTPAQTVNHIAKSVKFFRRREWPVNWQLILLIDVNEIRGFMGIFNKNLTLVHFKELKVDGLEYRNSKDFVSEITEEVLVELITVELEGSKFKHDSIGSDKKESEESNNKDKKKSGTFLIETKSFVEVLNCSEVIYLKYEILENLDIKIQLHGKLFKNFENLEILELKINNVSGFLQIEEIFKFDQVQDVKFLKMIKLKLVKLSKILELIDILQTQLSSINLISITLNEIIFSYNSPDNVIKLKHSSEGIKTIEFSDINPHKLCQLSIQEYLNRNGISKLVKYLTNSITLYEKLKTISKINELPTNDIKQNVSVEIIPKSLNNFDILYFNNQLGELIRLIIQIKKQENDIFRFYLSVECSSPKNQVRFDEIFKFNNKQGLIKFGKGAILLNDSVYLGGEELEKGLDYLNELILERFK